jgi:uncharacterized protein
MKPRSADLAASDPMPARAGIGLRAPHYREVLEQRPSIGFVEVHSENYFGLGGAPAHWLERVRERYPLSLHGVGLSLGSADPLSEQHLIRLRALIERYQPALVSEHLCWNSVDSRFFNDLLPLPQTERVVAHVASRVEQAQDALGRELLIENLSSYLQYSADEMPEEAFLVAVARRAGCSLLLDINNIYVSSRNHGLDPFRYVDAIPPSLVGEIHLAGHSERSVEGGLLLIDTHDQPVDAAVWALYRHALKRFGPRPTLVEWDTALPPLATLVAEAAHADLLMEECRARAA